MLLTARRLEERVGEPERLLGRKTREVKPDWARGAPFMAARAIYSVAKAGWPRHLQNPVLKVAQTFFRPSDLLQPVG
jgi:hypothetical protein